jgi:SAM-dependent methyltransferase
MLAVARGRAKPAGATIHFLEADASALPVPSPLVDAIFSRFGVMFFAEPVVAMAALRAQGRPGAALAFVCWRAPADNPWAMAPLMAVRALLPPQPPADPLAPGPFAFADAGRLNTILEDAGWRDVALAPFEAPMRLGATLAEAAEAVLKMGPAAALLREAGEGLEVAAHAAVAEALAPFKGPEGVSPPGAVWVVTARA